MVATGCLHLLLLPHCWLRCGTDAIILFVFDTVHADEFWFVQDKVWVIRCDINHTLGGVKTPAAAFAAFVFTAEAKMEIPAGLQSSHALHSARFVIFGDAIK